MERFHEIEDGAAILASKGVYKQVKLFKRAGELYAQYGGGFIRLYEKGTSLPSIRLEDYECKETVTVGVHGKLFVSA